MKKITLLPLFLIFFSLAAISQKKESYKNDSTRHKKIAVKTYTAKPSQAIYVEGGGNSILYSINYDRRFTKRLDGFGFRVGASYFTLGDYSLTAFPVGINILAGSKSNFVELGVNATAVIPKSSGIFGTITEAKFGQIDLSKDELHMIYGFALGYRYQPAKKGFNFRAGFEPLLGNRLDGEMVFAITAHISAGITF